MIDRVQFENFKSLQNLTLSLGRLTALVGANGCGKSSVLQGLKLALVAPANATRSNEAIPEATYLNLEVACLADLDMLRARGEHSHARAFLDEVEQRLVPRFRDA